MSKMLKPAFIDLFGAPGGMSLGFKLAGMRPVGALDIFKAGLDTYALNFPEVPEENIVCSDAGSPGAVERFQRISGLSRGSVDMIIGGPPCQGFSTIGRTKIASLVRNGQRSGRSSNARFIDDRRNNLYKSFIRFVETFGPKAVVMENVPGMTSYRNGRVVEQVKEDFAAAGYHNVESRVLNAADYGVPQLRKRIFFIAMRRRTQIVWPDATHSPATNGAKHKPLQTRHVTVRDALQDLPRLRLPAQNSKLRDDVLAYRHDPSCGFQTWTRRHSSKLHNNITRWHRRKDLSVFAHMRPGSRWSELPYADRRRIGYSNDSFHDKWKRLHPNRPSWTVNAHLSRDGYMYIHPTQNRTISVREAARLQSFPDRFVFVGSRSAQFRQVGNAVPPLLALAVAKSVKSMVV